MLTPAGVTATGDVTFFFDRVSFGARAIAQSLSSDRSGFAFMSVAGGEPWRIRGLRLEVGLGYVGMQTESVAGVARSAMRHGVGVLGSASWRLFRTRQIQPELHGWSVAGTSGTMLGLAVGLRFSQLGL
ncbi:MAG: hypothetical protein H7305_14235 [Gemmatimonadaceae bacterium]|nr:hypothetical protein [Gemmatimonadaceae bacterium]